jgi:intergrase/recombinase
MNTEQLKKDLKENKLNFKRDGESVGIVKLNAYCKAKAKDLREFGYNSVTENSIREELNKFAVGEEVSVIGMFMEDDLDY